MKPQKPTQYKHGDVHGPTGRIFLGYAFHNGKWYEKLYKSRTIFDAQIEIMRNSARKRAVDDQVPFDIDFQFLRSIATQTCPVFGIQLSWGTLGEQSVTDNSPSLDKIKPEWGYVKGNVCIMSHLANKIKQDVGWEEIMVLGNWLKIKEEEVKQNVRPEQLASIPARTYKSRKGNSEPGIISAAGIGEDCYDPDNYSGAVQGQNADHRAQEGSGNGVAGRDIQVVSPVQLALFQDNGYAEPEIVRLDFGSRYLPD